MMPARDNKGAVRYLHIGNVPFDKSIVDFNQKRLQERAKADNREVAFQMTVDDIYAISNGQLVGRPNK
jgi:methylaspartate mutase epsilon subunit